MSVQYSANYVQSNSGQISIMWVKNSNVHKAVLKMSFCVHLTNIVHSVCCSAYVDIDLFLFGFAANITNLFF